MFVPNEGTAWWAAEEADEGLKRSNLMLQDQSAGNCCLEKGQNV